MVALLFFNAIALLAQEASKARAFQYAKGAIVRGSLAERKLALVFTGHEYAEGADTILRELKRHDASGAFFLTGAFLANTNLAPVVKRIVHAGHYLGPHSDGHLLYLPWDGSTNLLVSHEQFTDDLNANLRKIEAAGRTWEQVRFFLPPYEHYNETITKWTREAGLTLVNFTPGTRSNADYTGETDRNFVPSKTIYDSILAREQRSPEGLNGFLLLLHIGAGPGRTDKFHAHFGDLLDELAGRGYRFVRVDELLKPSE
jgi:peptidoglycan/xylan/chitin deacetylase (PgdA/CDA1 family)